MSDTQTPVNRLGAFGIAVADLERSADFYRSVFGLVDVMTFDLAHMREIVLGSVGGKGASLVLMQYTDGTDNSWHGQPIKLVMYVADAKAVAESVLTNGGLVSIPPTVYPGAGGAVIGFVTDPDGHLIEIITR